VSAPYIDSGNTVDSAGGDESDERSKICSLECCNAAKFAHAFCSQESQSMIFGRYQDFVMHVAFMQLAYCCQTCGAFAEFVRPRSSFPKRFTRMPMSDETLVFMLLTVASILVLLMLSASCIMRCVWQRRHVASPVCAV
jgi:hypothetical protein